MNFNYQFKRERFLIGECTLEIECLKDLNQTIDQLFVELEKTGNTALLEELCPYFGTVWPAARALAMELWERQSEFQGKRVLELGCGLALPGILAAKLGAQVLATDFHPEVPGFLKRNLPLNLAPTDLKRLEYLRVDWSQGFPDLGHFDWVIGSDVLYEQSHALNLARVVAQFTAPQSGRALIADPARPYLQSFVDELKRLGLGSGTSVRTVADEPMPKDVFIVEFSAE